MKKYIYMITLLILVLDQGIKTLVTNQLELYVPKVMIPDFFQLQYVQNTGGAWGILGDNTGLLIVIGVFAVIILNRYLLQEKQFQWNLVLASGLFMGGLLGNLIDRIVYGFVIDYLDFYLFGYDFPVFNLADIAIVIGIGILMIEVIRGEINEYSSRKG